MKHTYFLIATVCALGPLSAKKMDDAAFQNQKDSSSCCEERVSEDMVAKHDGRVEKTKYSRSSGQVYVTNERDEEISVEWEVALSKGMKSSGHGRVDPETRKMHMRDNVNWMVDRDEAKMSPVYMLTIRAHSEALGHKMVGQKTKEVTLSECDLFGDDQKDSLYVTVGRDGKIDIAVGRAMH